jgi:type IV fimbrial biogenesis protein FimT
MTTRAPSAAESGFTLIELLIGLAIMGVLLVLAAPSFTSMIEMQRLRGTSDQLVTDFQFMRAEAVSRQEVTGISFGSNGTMTCYVVHTCGTMASADCSCDCTAATPTTRCALPRREVKVVQLLRSSKVEVRPIQVGTSPSVAERVMVNPATGGLVAFFPIGLVLIPPDLTSGFWAETSLASGSSAAGSLQTRLSALGRPSVCAPGGVVKGPVACP